MWPLAGTHVPSLLTASPLSPIARAPFWRCSGPHPSAAPLTLSVLFVLQPSVGQVARVDVSSKVEVVWADNSKTIILPQVSPCPDQLADSWGNWAGSHGLSPVPAQGTGGQALTSSW